VTRLPAAIRILVVLFVTILPLFGQWAATNGKDGRHSSSSNVTAEQTGVEFRPKKVVVSNGRYWAEAVVIVEYNTVATVDIWLGTKGSLSKYGLNEFRLTTGRWRIRSDSFNLPQKCTKWNSRVKDFYDGGSVQDNSSYRKIGSSC
jgi:hypothetical protein